MRTEKEIEQKLKDLKENLYKNVLDNEQLGMASLSRTKLIINILRWVMGEKSLIMSPKGGNKI